MRRLLYSFFACIFFIGTGLSQDKKGEEKEVDSLRNDLREEGIVLQDSIIVKRKPLNPLAPSKAAFYSAVLPGLGQIYNKRYWKLPIVYGLIGGSIYGYTYNNDLYRTFRTAFKERLAGLEDEFFAPENNEFGVVFSDEVLENQQEKYQRDRDLWLVVIIAMYALNIVDANVDAHLKQFNVDEDLSMDFEPFMDIDPVTMNPNYGMALIIKF